ncbi:MAG: class I SAM-dependent methyltransferase, partial [bacterium]
MMKLENPIEHSLSDNNILNPNYWDQRRKSYITRKIDPKNYNLFGVPFVDRLKPYLKPDITKRVLEIGCVPCEYLCALAKEFKYQVYGIDFTTKIHLAADFLKANGIKNFKLFNEDFLSWRTDERFDIILSLGFIEHFIDYESVIEKHIELLADSGYLVLGLPNFRYGQFFMRCLIDKEHIRRHIMDCMNLKKIRSILEEKGMTVHELDYIGGTFNIGTIGFDKQIKRNIFQKVLLKITEGIAWRTESILKKGNINIPNRYFSPYIFSISQKKIFSSN